MKLESRFTAERESGMTSWNLSHGKVCANLLGPGDEDSRIQMNETVDCLPVLEDDPTPAKTYVNNSIGGVHVFMGK